VAVPHLREAPVLVERTWVGLDVHARSVVACAIDGAAGEMRTQRVSPRTEAVVEWVRMLLPGPVAVAYEAGPTGFGLARALGATGVRCVVVAPSKLERPPGDRVKTDRRDAERLARLLRIGELPVVRVPTEAEEAARDLVRAREDARADLMRVRHRLSKLLLRHGLVWDAGAWTGAHESWLRAQRFDRPGLQLAFDEAFDAVLTAHARRDRLDAAIVEMAGTSEFAPVVGRLCCLRGIGPLTAFGLAVEVGDWRRFTGSSIGAYLGLVPTESSSGERRVQGGITKTGNSHARRLLVEAAWHHRKPYRPSRELIRRRDGQPPAVRERADRGNRRLHRRWARLDARSKRSTISAVAVARELAGWTWSLAIMDS
jgi:transposase